MAQAILPKKLKPLQLLFGKTLSDEIETEKAFAKIRFLALISVILLCFLFLWIDYLYFFGPELWFILGWLSIYNIINGILLQKNLYHPLVKYITTAGDVFCATLLVRLTGDVSSPFLNGYGLVILVYGVRYGLGYSIYTAALITIFYMMFVMIEASGILLFGSGNIFFEFIRMLVLWAQALLSQSESSSQVNRQLWPPCEKINAGTPGAISNSPTMPRSSDTQRSPIRAACISTR